MIRWRRVLGQYRSDMQSEIQGVRPTGRLMCFLPIHARPLGGRQRGTDIWGTVFLVDSLEAHLGCGLSSGFFGSTFSREIGVSGCHTYSPSFFRICRQIDAAVIVYVSCSIHHL